VLGGVLYFFELPLYNLPSPLTVFGANNMLKPSSLDVKFFYTRISP